MSSQPISKKSKVVIIGSGMSGLAAANALIDAGWNNIQILEARDRIGGRTYTHNIKGTSAEVDLGASLILGDIDNPVAAACDEYNIPYDAFPFQISAVVDADDGNRRIPLKELEEIREMLPELTDLLTPTKSAKEAIIELLDQKSTTNDDRRRRIQKFVLEQAIAGGFGLEERLAAYYPVKGITGKMCLGQNCMIEKGYSSLVNSISMGIPIQLEHVVDCIRLVEDGAAVEVTCRDGKEIKADYVIVTVPLGVLKSSCIDFEPSLSQNKRNSLSRLDMGNFEKVILTFPERFWDDSFQDNIGIYHKTTPEGFRPFSMFVDITKFAGAPTIACIYDGMFARSTQDDLGVSDNNLVSLCREALAALLDMHVDDVPMHTGSHVTHWRSDPYSYGSYSYFVVGSTPGDMEELANPEWNGRLMFAGEHTFAEYNGTVHGAILSGLREAKRLDPKVGFPGIHDSRFMSNAEAERL